MNAGGVLHNCLFLVLICITRTSSHEYDPSDIEDFTNDEPIGLAHKVKSHKYKLGSDITLRCYNKNNYTRDGIISWEFKRCDSNYKGVQYEPDELYKIDEKDSAWKHLDYLEGNRKLELKNSSKENTGLYRCLHNDKNIIIVFIVDVVVKVAGPPIVKSVVPLNATLTPNSLLSIQCTAESQEPPVILWLRDCPRGACDMVDNKRCYCKIPQLMPSQFRENLTSLVYHREKNFYSSKLSVRTIDSANYTCLVVSAAGRDYRTVTVTVQGPFFSDNDSIRNAQIIGQDESWFPLLFLIPLIFILVPVIILLCCYNSRNVSTANNGTVIVSEQKRNLIRGVNTNTTVLHHV